MNSRLIKWIIYSIVIFILSSCSHDDNNPISVGSYERGEISETELLGSYTQATLQQLLNSLELDTTFTLSNSVKAYSVNYYTVDKDGNNELASGAIFIPDNLDNLPIVSIQHGTETYSQGVASVNPLNSLEGAGGLLLASMGYFVLAPDYLGYGVSHIMHPYLNASSLTPCIIDFIRAGKNYSTKYQISLDGNLFLLGYSEGGYLTLATQKEIESNYSSEFNLTAVVPMSGPYNLLGTADSIFANKKYSTPLYIGFLFTAYNNIYNWNKLDDIFKPPYSSRVTTLFDGSKTWDEITSQLPNNFEDLVRAEFIESYLSGTEEEVINALNENTLLNWKPIAPIHFFHGDADEVVPYENVLDAIKSFESKGATNIQLTTIPGGTHETTGRPAIIGAIEWISTFHRSLLSASVH